MVQQTNFFDSLIIILENLRSDQNDQNKKIDILNKQISDLKLKQSIEIESLKAEIKSNYYMLVGFMLIIIRLIVTNQDLSKNNL